MGLEAMQRSASSSLLPAGPGGQLGQLILRLLVTHLGSQGGALLLIAGAAIWACRFFGCSWLNSAEKLGFYLERIYLGAQHWWSERVAAHAAKPVPEKATKTPPAKERPAKEKAAAQPNASASDAASSDQPASKGKQSLRDWFNRRSSAHAGQTEQTEPGRSEPSLSGAVDTAASDSQRREPRLAPVQQTAAAAGAASAATALASRPQEIGRASCRERGHTRARDEAARRGGRGRHRSR